MKVLGIYRSPRYSPNSVEKDRLIMSRTLDAVRAEGWEVMELNEDELVERGSVFDVDAVLSMARSVSALAVLNASKAEIINSPDGVALCVRRKELERVMRELDVPCAEEFPIGMDCTKPCWVKRADGCAETADDVVFCATADDMQTAISQMNDRGISEISVQKHVEGDLVKFYGVCDTSFFRYSYPTDEGRSKFGAEIHNGTARHYPFDVGILKQTVERLARHIGVPVYGGDAIVKSDGAFVIIDFNDWPSFSAYSEEAGKAIASLIIK